MYKPFPFNFKYIPLNQLDTFEKLNTKDLVTFRYEEFNECYREAIAWNNCHAGKTNTEIRFELHEDKQSMTAFLYRFGM